MRTVDTVAPLRARSSGASDRPSQILREEPRGA